jgi:CHAT domain-containing protein
VISSYTPTLTTLLRAQRSVKPLARAHLALLLIAEKRAHESLAIIPGVDVEIQDIAAIATLHNMKIIDQVMGSTTIAQTSKNLNAANIIHLACHGVQDHQDATKSGFCLGDGRLTISELMRLDIKDGFLAFLSACETAKGSDEQPDQAMHLAAAMLFAGFKSVIATMWLVT